jgi:hypothetical protein
MIPYAVRAASVADALVLPGNDRDARLFAAGHSRIPLTNHAAQAELNPGCTGSASRRRGDL